MTEYLITCHCDVRNTDSDGRMSMLEAHHFMQLDGHWSGSEERAEYIIAGHYDIRNTDMGGCTILHIACQIGKLTLGIHVVGNYPALLTMKDNLALTPVLVTGLT